VPVSCSRSGWELDLRSPFVVGGDEPEQQLAAGVIERRGARSTRPDGAWGVAVERASVAARRGVETHPMAQRCVRPRGKLRPSSAQIERFGFQGGVSWSRSDQLGLPA
jgi:hypothetical protein